MKHKPLKFTPDMEKAALDGSKTHTRRPIIAPKMNWYEGGTDVPIWSDAYIDSNRTEQYLHLPFNHLKKTGERGDYSVQRILSPYGPPGTRFPIGGKAGEIVGNRIQRIQDMNHNDCVKEGFYGSNEFDPFWDAIYEKRGFGISENPWVWDIEFRVLKVGQPS